ncbi:MAG: hypothetical protein U5L09_00120 [Bacteroidales bacterium]|nr:hypothetical protein [Bacteroidales bacterium]
MMAGTVMIALTTYAGINFKGEHLVINPDLPDLWRALAFSSAVERHGLRF